MNKIGINLIIIYKALSLISDFNEANIMKI